MLDWLRRDPLDSPTIVLSGRELPVVVRRLAHARRMTLRLGSDGSDVRLSIPRWARTQDALAFAATRIDWLERQLAALPPPVAVGPGAVVRYRGAALRIVHAAGHRRAPALDGDALLLGGQEQSVAGRVRRWLEGSARALCSDDLAHYCELIDRPAPALSLSSAKRRWGSCGPDGAIRINWRLVMAPDAVRRSVVAHEVAHLVHFDHGPRFHALLGDLFEGDVTEANLWLKREGRGLYAAFG